MEFLHTAVNLMITGIEVALAVGIALFLGEVVPVFFYKKGNDV